MATHTETVPRGLTPEQWATRLETQAIEQESEAAEWAAWRRARATALRAGTASPPPPGTPE
jgi:hypothetical protein